MKSRIKVIATISLVLNVLFAGIFLGDVAHRFMLASPDINSELAGLAPEKRALFETILEPAKLQMDKQHAQIDEAKKEALHILQLPSFNSDAYLKQVRHIEDIRMQMKLQMAEAVIALAKQLSPEERSVLVDILSHPPFAPLPPGTLQPAASSPTGQRGIPVR